MKDFRSTVWVKNGSFFVVFGSSLLIFFIRRMYGKHGKRKGQYYDV